MVSRFINYNYIIKFTNNFFQAAHALTNETKYFDEEVIITYGNKLGFINVFYDKDIYEKYGFDLDNLDDYYKNDGIRWYNKILGNIFNIWL